MDYKYNRNRIIRAAVSDTLDARHEWFAAIGSTDVDFDDAENEDLTVGPTRDVPAIIKGLGVYDEEGIYFLNGLEEVQAWIMVLNDHGSNPGECMVNYTMNLEEPLERAHAISSDVMDAWDRQMVS